MWWMVSYVTQRLFRLKPAIINRKRSSIATAEAPKHFLYAINYDVQGKLFKVGKTGNLDQRLRRYRTLVAGGKWFHTIECIDMHMAEKLLHGLLKSNGLHVEREIFRGTGTQIKAMMDLVMQIDRVIHENKSTVAATQRLTDALRKL